MMAQINQVLKNEKRWVVETGNSFDVLDSIPDESVQTVITSPPYYQLRDYSSTPAIIGGVELLD